MLYHFSTFSCLVRRFVAIYKQLNIYINKQHLKVEFVALFRKCVRHFAVFTSRNIDTFLSIVKKTWIDNLLARCELNETHSCLILTIPKV